MVTAEERALGSTVFKEVSRELTEATSDAKHFKRRLRRGYLLLSKVKE